MKLLLSFLLYSFIICGTVAQQDNGKVISTNNAVSISDVVIISSDSTYKTLTNNEGDFYIPKSGSYLFSKEGFFNTTTYLDVSKFNVVELSSSIENLTEVIVSSNHFQQNIKKLPTAITVISSQVLEKSNSVNIAPILNSVPGMYMHNGTLTTNRITIRGIGSRNLFGTSKIRAYYEDIPLTNGSGSSTIEDLEIRALGQIEVIKGPSSSMYGAGLGGSIQLIPNKGLFNHNAFSSNYTFGSFGLQKYLLQANIGNPKSSANMTYSNLQSDGYRENNETTRQVITFASKHFINRFNKITFVANYIDLKAFIPSSINEDAFLNHPSQAAFTWKRSKGFEDYKKGLFGLSWEHLYSLRTKQHTSVFTSFLDSYEPRPFNILNENTKGIGIRSRISSNTTLFNNKLNWTIGGELFYDTNTFQTYENLYEDHPPEIGSVKGNLLSDFKEKRSYANGFFDSNYDITSKTKLSFGFNINTTSYKLLDYFNTDEINYSGTYHFKTILSPKFGITHDISENVMLYSTISHGFSPPSLEETLLPDGLINTNIKPESGWNYEIGSRGNLFNRKLQFDIALYKMDVKNLLVARRTEDDQYIGINAGKTTYNGLELMLNYNIVSTNNFKLYANNAFSYNDFKFRFFIDDTNNYSGNDLTGVPEFTINTTLNFETTSGFYGLINYNSVGKIPIKDDNSIYSKTYQLVNSKIGYKFSNLKALQFNLYVGLNNIFNEKYASMLLINARGFGGNAPRYYYPGEPNNYAAGLGLSYSFK
jgi:iron complex outermembrane receptor protein